MGGGVKLWKQKWEKSDKLQETNKLIKEETHCLFMLGWKFIKNKTTSWKTLNNQYWPRISSSVFFLIDDMIPDICNIWLPVPTLGTKTQDTLYQLLLLNYWEALWEIWCYDEKFSYNYAHKLRTAYEADAHRQLTLLADIWKCCKQTFSNESVS